ncbi:MAG: SDR family NAD(P)-dependent oxidoreductase [Methylococcaceae bacterium]
MEPFPPDLQAALILCRLIADSSDAGFTDPDDLPKQTTGVFVGNTLTGEFSRAALLRLRWPYVRRVFDARLQSMGWDAEQRHSFLEEAEIDFKAPFEPVNEETLAGGLSNTIAGRICNHFDLSGGGYTLDGACSSSLLALANACDALTTGDLNAAVVGGVDLSLDPFELIGFAKVGALAESDMRVYDRHSHGFLPGEGCGFVVLMRHEEAIARNLRYYAVIKGWGISSDGNGGITRPEIEGQRLALQRAYQRAGYDINSIGLFEGHGTGTKVGDEVELSALIAELSIKRRLQPAAISSIKANIGHTKAAAGIAGFIKAVMAIHHQLIPPATGFFNPHPILETNADVLQVLKQGKCWPQNRPRRMGVSSFGFGGINAHITLEGNNPNDHKTILSVKEKKLLASYQDTELFFFSGQRAEDLTHSVQSLLTIAARLSYAELVDVAAQLAKHSNGQANFRAAITASTPPELYRRLEILLGWLNQGIEQRIDLVDSVFLGSRKNKPRIAFLFPGQAAPVRLNGGLMTRRFADVENLYQQINLADDPNNVLSTAVAQPAIIAAQLAGMQLLQRFGINADNVLGHSLGELSSLYWSGAMDENTLLRLAKIRGQVMQNAPIGAMASIGADSRSVSALLESEQGLVIAGFNSSNQTVIAGETNAVKRFVAGIQSKGIMATILPVAHAFHSPLMQPVATELKIHLSKEQFQPVNRAFFSTVTGARLQEDINIVDLLTQQLTTPVRFLDAASSLLPVTDLAIEVGPGTILSGLLSDQKEVPVISLDVSGSSLVGLLQALGAIYALGGPVNRNTLFDDRFYRPFDLNWKPVFFANPCESAPLSGETLPAKKIAAKAVESKVIPADLDSSQTTLELVMQLVASRTELPLAALQPQKRLLADLHLNSISVSELVVAASRQLKVTPPAATLDYSNVTIAELAEGLQAIQIAGGHMDNQLEQFPPGVDNWVRTFSINKKPCPLRAVENPFKGNGLWQCFSSDAQINLDSLSLKLKNWGGSGVLLYLPGEFKESDIAVLLEATQTSLKQQATERYFVLLQAQNCIASSVIKTLFLESQHLTTLVIEAPAYHPAIEEWIIAELHAAKGYTEVYYDDNGDRWQSMLALQSLASENNDLPLDTDDVLLVTGGGKGIAAECALMLAQETGAKLAVLGRSAPENDEELAANLQRFSAHGIDYRYLQADVCVEDEVRSAVIALESDFGTVTALLHGAGINHPQLLSALDETTFLRTLAPKVDGLNHLLSAIQADKLKLLLNFGSIIARSGMRGEADYALANAWQTRILEQFNERYPDCRCLSVEWSVWSGVGMGERLGRIDALLREGISPINPAQGVDMLCRLVSAKQPFNSVIVTGRLGELPTLTLEQPELPFLRFLERTRAYYPGVELIVEADLSTDSDPYLQDHVFQGEQLLPGVMGLEAMAQVAMALADKTCSPSFEQVEFL